MVSNVTTRCQPTVAAINITLFSYDGVLHLGVNLDARAVTNPSLLVDCLRSGLDATLALTAD